jgi:hypothetical protein
MGRAWPGENDRLSGLATARPGPLQTWITWCYRSGPASVPRLNRWPTPSSETTTRPPDIHLVVGLDALPQWLCVPGFDERPAVAAATAEAASGDDAKLPGGLPKSSSRHSTPNTPRAASSSAGGRSSIPMAVFNLSPTSMGASRVAEVRLYPH